MKFLRLAYYASSNIFVLLYFIGTAVSNLVINIIRIPLQFFIAVLIILLLIVFAPLALLLYLVPTTRDFANNYMRILYATAIFLLKTIRYSQYIKTPTFIKLDELIEIESSIL
jgi:hypothetical protein